ncbi:MAG: exo-alpha-sialidase [Planctomycetota bacterium]|jgi:sialidase-1
MIPTRFGLKLDVVSLLLLTIACLAPTCVAKQDQQPAPQLDSVAYVSGTEGYACYRCPTLAVSNAGTVLAFCEGRVHGHKDEDDMDVVLKRSTDGGRTWGPLQVLANDGKNPCKCQCPVVLPSGRILLVWLWNKWIPSEKDRTTREVYVMHSDDDGVTWSKARKITDSVYESDWQWYGTGPCHGIVMRSDPYKGRIVVPARHNTKKAHMVSHVIYSDDGGDTWQRGGSVPRQQTTECTVVELSNGDLMLNSRNQNDRENHRVVSISKDGGQTFTETWLESQLVEPRGCQASLLFHSLNTKTQKGNILFSNPANAEYRSDGTLKLSQDDGRTWTNSFRYAKQPAPNFTGYSDIALMPDQSIGILHERGSLEEASKKSDRYDEIGFTVVGFDQIKELK